MFTHSVISNGNTNLDIGQYFIEITAPGAVTTDPTTFYSFSLSLDSVDVEAQQGFDRDTPVQVLAERGVPGDHYVEVSYAFSGELGNYTVNVSVDSNSVFLGNDLQRSKNTPHRESSREKSP